MSEERYYLEMNMYEVPPRADPLFPIEVHCPFCGRAIVPKRFIINTAVNVEDARQKYGDQTNRLYYCHQKRDTFAITLVWFEEVWVFSDVIKRDGTAWEEERNLLEEYGNPTIVDDCPREDGAI